MKTKRTFSIALIALAAVVSAVSVTAQGRYVGQLSRTDVDGRIKRLEDSGDQFRDDFKREVDRSNLSGSQKRRYKDQVEKFEDSTDRLRKRFDSDNTWWESRRQVEDVITNSRPLNTTMNGISFRRNLERQWNQLRNDINQLADTYDMPGINGGGWNGGPWNPGTPGFPGNPGGPGFPGFPGNPGGPIGPAPNWLIGTFFSGYPQVLVTVRNNGQVSRTENNRVTYGRYYKAHIYFDGEVWSVKQNGNGFRAQNRGGGQTKYFQRGEGGAGWSGQMSAPPRWLRGTFESEKGPQITMTFDRNGRVTANIGGRAVYGRYYYGQIFLDGTVWTAIRDRNGMMAHNRNTGQTTNFRRR